ncbi:helix-turn-helix domain-containing protein [Ulvibacterium sp.]|uniref:helix-turn-helix domain-containing protein n=1 Tax=Ulvibacterium sp. TaxID=2665914 RepID=UPI00345C7105
MDLEQKEQLKWVRLFEDCGDAGRVCLKYGISRPTLGKWFKRYREDGIDGLKDQSRKPPLRPQRKPHRSGAYLTINFSNLALVEIPSLCFDWFPYRAPQ